MDHNNEETEESVKMMLKRSLVAKNKLAVIKTGEDGAKLYTCVECSAQFDVIEKIEYHLLSHFNAYRYLCGVCGTGLKRREHLDRHMQEHTEYRPHICPQCGKGFKRKEHLNIHSSIHSGDKTLFCSLCQKAFYRKDHLQKHLQTHNRHFMEQNIIPMSELELTSVKAEEMTDEYEGSDTMNTDDGSGDGEENRIEIEVDVPDFSNGHFLDYMDQPIVDPSRPFMCNVCGKSYKRKDHLKIHSWTHKEKSIFCKECGKAFHTSDQLLVHVNMVHIRAYTMNDTQEVSQLRQMLGDQIDIKVLNHKPAPPAKKDPNNRPHECHICHRKFKRKQHLKIHGNVHRKQSQSKPIWCPICHEGFSDNNQFESHQCLPANLKNGDYTPVVLGDYEEGQGSPPQDAKKENNPMELLEVVVNEEPNEEDHIPAPARVFVCKFCSKHFKRKDHYKIHLHIHTGVKSCFCPDCGKGFYRKDHLQKHMIVHAKMHKPQKAKPRKEIPGLLPIDILKAHDALTHEVKPEITIHAPSNSKLRVPLQMKVPYQMVMSMDNGEQKAFTIDPQTSKTE